MTEFAQQAASAVNAAIDCALDNLVCAGIEIDRMMRWNEIGGSQGVMVDGRKACCVSFAFVDLRFEVTTKWLGEFEHLGMPREHPYR